MNAFPIIIRPEYLEICEGDHCAAAILDLFKRWSVNKLKKKVDAWIYKSQPELRDDLMGLFGLNKVAEALLKLRDWGYLRHRQNPRNRQDKTLQYQVNDGQIEECLTLLLGAPDIETDAPKPQDEGSGTLNLKPQAPVLMASESMNQSLSPSGIEALKSSSMPAHRPDDDDIEFFKTFEKRFGDLQDAQIAQLANYRDLLGLAGTREVMKRCDASDGRSWSYVLKAMLNASASKVGQRFEGQESARFNDDTPSPADEQPPVLPDQVYVSEDETHPDEPDDDATPPVEIPKPDHEQREVWNNAYSQLEIQLDRATFDTWLRGAWLRENDGWNLTVAVSNSYAAQMLQHRIYRDIRRVVSDLAGHDVEITFVVDRMPPKTEPPLFKILAQEGMKCRNGVWS